MCMADCVVERDAAGNRKLKKKRSSGRIDCAVTLAMAIAAAPRRGRNPSTLRV
jgi:phage terminase large subunit-like protein